MSRNTSAHSFSSSGRVSVFTDPPGIGTSTAVASLRRSRARRAAMSAPRGSTTAPVAFASRASQRHPSIEIVTPEMRVAARREHLHGSPAHVEDGHVERASSEVEDEHRLVTVDVHAVRERRSDGLVEDFDFFQSRALGGASRGVALLVVEIRGDGDDGAVDGFAERVARSVNESAEDVCGDFFRRELASERGASRARRNRRRPRGARGRRCRGRRRRRRLWRTPRRERGGRPRPRACPCIACR